MYQDMMMPQDMSQGGPPPGFPGAGGPVDQGGGFPPDQGGSPEDQPIDLLKQMIDLAKSYLDVEPDEEDKATMTKVLQLLQQYLAKDQADAQAAMGGNPTIARVLRKAG